MSRVLAMMSQRVREHLRHCRERTSLVQRLLDRRRSPAPVAGKQRRCALQHSA